MIIATWEQQRHLLRLVRDCPLYTKDDKPLTGTFELLKDWVNDTSDHYASIIINGIENL